MATISVAIATYNEEKNLETCLSSVYGWTEEIVLVDGGSTDKTIAIAKKYNAKIIKTDNPPIFHINKQKALDACHSDWILQLDADEIVEKSLKEEILEIINNTKSFDGYFIPRKNYFLGHWLSKGGLYPDEVIRLFKNKKGKYPSKSVHEQIEISGSVGHLHNPLIHNTSPTFADYWKKADTYTSLQAKSLISPSFLQYFFWLPLKTFFLIFVQNKGFIDGIYGFLFALFSSLHFPIAYWKNVRSL